jgi:hypothetical protein
MILSGHNCWLQSGHNMALSAEHIVFHLTIGHLFSLVNKALYLLHFLSPFPTREDKSNLLHGCGKIVSVVCK